MAEHRRTVHPSKPLEVENAALVVETFVEGAKFGGVRISRVSIGGAPRGHRHSRVLTWEEFNALVQEHGRDA